MLSWGVYLRISRGEKVPSRPELPLPKTMMVIVVLAVAALMSASAPAPTAPSCNGNPKPAGAGCGPLFTPGWGFQSHGGFPPVPWHRGGGGPAVAMEAMAAYFVGNATGMDSPAELLRESRLGYVGIGVQFAVLLHSTSEGNIAKHRPPAP